MKRIGDSGDLCRTPALSSQREVSSLLTIRVVVCSDRNDLIICMNQSGTCFICKLSRSCTWLTVSNVSEISSESTEAICLFDSQTVWICSTSSSNAVLVNQFCQFSIWLSGSSLCCSAKSLSLQAITASIIFPIVLKRAIGHQAPGSE